MKIVRKVVFSDLSGEEGAEPTTFAINGNTYEIDLTHEERNELLANLDGFIQSARRLRGNHRPTGPRMSHAAKSSARPQDIRDWCRKKGIKVSDKGRVPRTIEEQYDRAMEAASAPAPEKIPPRPAKPALVAVPEPVAKSTRATKAAKTAKATKTTTRPVGAVKFSAGRGGR